MRFDFLSGHLMIYIQKSMVRHVLRRDSHKAPGSGSFRSETVPFPATRIVQGFYEMLLGKPSGDGFYKHLATRTRGPAPSADNLISACVAFYLRNNGKIQSPKEIHRLLNRHVLCETHKVLPEEGVATSESNQLWRDVNDRAKVYDPLWEVGYTLYWEGDIH